MRPSRVLVATVACGVSFAVACGGDDDGGGSAGAGGASSGGASSGGASSGGASSGGSSSGGSSSGGSSSGGTGGATGGSGGATGGSGGTGGAGSYPLDCKSFTSATTDAACTSLSSEYCKFVGKCAPVLFSMLGFKDEVTCGARMNLVCQNASAAAGNGLKPAFYAAYGSWLSKLTCAQMWDGTFENGSGGTAPAECGGNGTLANGKTCFSDVQCVGGCEKDSDAACGKCLTLKAGMACAFQVDCGDDMYCDANGKCAPKLALGATCTGGSNDCVDGAYCDSTSKKCVAQGGAGAACASGTQCKNPFICGTNKQCKVPAVAAQGAACDPNEAQSCNNWMGLACDASSKTCVASSMPGPGQACGMLPTDGGYVLALYCSGGAVCTDHTTGSNTCMLPAADGATCSNDDGPPCQMPAECVNGKCVVPSATTCPAN